MNSFDLQIQSRASDGAHTPFDIVRMAREENVRTIAITDHDTVAGVEEALRAGAEEDVRVIPGIEMSLEEHDMHLLGYGIDHTNPDLCVAIERFRESRIEGAKIMVENLRANEGFVLEWEDVMREAASSATVTRPHIVSAVMKRPENTERLTRDGVRTKQDFFKKYLSNDSRNYVRRGHIAARDAIDLIHRAGGVAIWSHPTIPDFQKDGYDELEKFLESLRGWGIDGLEVWSASHREDDVEFLYCLAEKYRLLKTGGSDFHEKGEHLAGPDGLHSARRIGDFETYGFPTEDILPRLFTAIEARRGGLA